MRRTLAALGCSIGLLVAACGGVTSQAGESGASSADAGAGVGGPCDMAGAYTQHFSVESGGGACPNLFDQTITISAKAVANGEHGAGNVDAGADCSWTVNTSACTLTTSCAVSGMGYTSTASGTIAFQGSSGFGKESIEIMDSNGDVLATCVYDVTMTRR